MSSEELFQQCHRVLERLVAHSGQSGRERVTGISFLNAQPRAAFQFALPGASGSAAAARGFVSLAARFPARSYCVAVLATARPLECAAFVTALRADSVRVGVRLERVLWTNAARFGHWGGPLESRVMETELADNQSPIVNGSSAGGPIARPIRESALDLDVREVHQAYASLEPVSPLACADAAGRLLAGTARARHLATALRALERPAVRDHFLWCLLAPGAQPSSAQSGDASSRASDLATLLLGRSAQPPKPAHLARCQRVVQRLIHVSPGAHFAALSSLEAWLSWARGESTRALAQLDAALDRDPHCVLARVLREGVVAGLVPDWAFAPSGSGVYSQRS